MFKKGMLINLRLGLPSNFLPATMLQKLNKLNREKLNLSRTIALFKSKFYLGKSFPKLLMAFCDKSCHLGKIISNVFSKQ